MPPCGRIVSGPAAGVLVVLALALLPTPGPGQGFDLLPKGWPLTASEADEPAPPRQTPRPEARGASEPPKGEPRRYPLEATWADGLRFASADGHFRLHVGGSAQIDSTWLIGPDSVFLTNAGGPNGIGNSAATFLRRARLRVDGGIYDQFDFVLEYNLANADNDNDGLQPPSFSDLNGSPAPADVWMQVRDVPVLGNVRMGYQAKPIGLARNTSHLFQPFLERPDNQDAFYAPFDTGRAPGITSRNHSESERVTWQYGVYRPLTNVFGVALNKGAVGGRATALPWDEDGGERLVHVGLGVWASELVQNRLRVRARPLLRNGPGFAVPALADTGQIPGSRQGILAPEFAAVLGPWTVRAEWAGQWLTEAVAGGRPQGTVFFQGGYAEVLYFLT